MAKIKQLSQLEAQKIAAGEVVERPANVVKELVENSLDAGSTQISLFLEDGGKKLIKIVDNGCGMSPEDARLSIKQYATSKIDKVDDLEWISTFGFRGEALASISAVSKLNLITKEETNQLAIALEINQANIEKETFIASNTGTEISIEDLFFNVIVRKKFLKSKDTELRAIIQLFYAFVLQNLNVSFKIYHDNKLLYNCPATNDTKSRIAQIFDANLAQNILILDKISDNMGLKISGAISKPEYFRYDKNQIFVFVNKRWVKNYKLSSAIIKGYQGMLQTDRYPAGAIFITIDQKFVDINIHPRKEEVQFLHPVVVEKFIESAVKEALENNFDKNLGKNENINFIKKSEENKLNTKNYNFEPKFYNQENLNNFTKEFKENNLEKKLEENKNFIQIIENAFSSPEIISQDTKNSKIIFENQPDDINNKNKESITNISQDALEYTLIGQTKLTYIIIETAEGLVFIDQHAAHERIMYEKLKTNFKNVPRIKLLFPQIITLNQNDIKTLIPYLVLFEDFGLIIEHLNLNQLVLKEAPIFLNSQPVEDLLAQAVSLIDQNQESELILIQEKLQEKLHAQLSCKAAIRAGDQLSIETMNQIVKDLYKIENKLTCPHGRPTIWALSEYEIEKKFKRNYK